MLYAFLKILLRTGMFFYYRKMTFKGREHLDYKGPKVIIANHPNTIMDAWIVGAASREPVYFMAKGTFFNTPLKKWFLHALGLIPVNRSTDVQVEGVSNEDSFEQCYRLLESGKSLVIFPEGSSFAERFLRKLKSGTARIVLQTEERNNGKLGVKVVPIGIIYQQPDKFRSSVLVKIGEPIDPLPYLELFRHDRLKAARLLTEKFREGLSSLLVVADTKVAETLSDRVASILDNAYVGKGSRFERRIELLAEVNDRINWIERNDPEAFKTIEEVTNRVQWQIERLAIKSSFLDRRFRSTMFIRQLLVSVLAMTLALPVYLYGFIHHIIPFKLAEWLMKKMVHEVEYYAPIAILFGLALYPFTYWGWVALFHLLTDLPGIWTWLYLLSLPVSGLFAYAFYRYYQHITFKWKYILLMIDKRDAMDRLHDDREELRHLIFP